MSDKDSNIRSTQQDESQDETQSYPMERLTSEAPPPYSEVVGHSQTANNDPASERNEQASPYQPPAVQQDISLPPVRLVSNNPTPPTRVVVVTPPQPSPDTQLSQNAVQSQVEIKLFSAVFCSLILFFLATPLSLLVTLPSIYCICKAKYDVKRGKVSKARQESVTGCKIIAITVIVTLTIFPSLMIPLIFLVF